jgi:hypothetical protein
MVKATYFYGLSGKFTLFFSDKILYDQNTFLLLLGIDVYFLRTIGAIPKSI